MNKFFLKINPNKFIDCTNIKMVVFDMAGTTINEHGIVYKTLHSSMNQFGLTVRKKEIQKWHGINKYQVLDHFLLRENRDKKDTEKLQNELYKLFENNLKKEYFESSTISLIDNKVPLLFKKLRQKDIKIALNTGYSVDIQIAIIDKLKIDSYIDDFISSEEVKIGRPYPYMIHTLMERNNIKNSKEVIKFGDTQNDILEGLNANCYASVGVLSGADTKDKLQNADFIVNSVMDIKLY